MIAVTVGNFTAYLVAMRDVGTSADNPVIAEVAKVLEAAGRGLVVFSIDMNDTERRLELTDEKRNPVNLVNTTRGPHAHFDLAVPVGDVCAFYRAAEVRGRLEASDSRTVVEGVGVWRALWSGAPRPWPLLLAAHRGSPWCRWPARMRPRTWRPTGKRRGKSKPHSTTAGRHPLTYREHEHTRTHTHTHAHTHTLRYRYRCACTPSSCSLPGSWQSRARLSCK
jgi:hypothetical protein